MRTWQRLSRPFRRWQPDSDIETPIGPLNSAFTRLLSLEAAMALYIKHHSWGEFVFDWS